MDFIEPCFGIGHNLSLICQMTSEDIKHQLIIIITSPAVVCSFRKCIKIKMAKISVCRDVDSDAEVTEASVTSSASWSCVEGLYPLVRLCAERGLAHLAENYTQQVIIAANCSTLDPPCPPFSSQLLFFLWCKPSS